MALTLAGAAVRIWQYAGNASLWIDEIAIAENVVGRSAGRLLGEPLAFNQIAPPGFLLAVKASVSLLGNSEPALRLFPFAAGIASLLLFAILAGRILEGWTAPFAVGLFAFGVPLIRYAAEVKQYSSDVAVALLLTLLGLGLANGRAARSRVLVAGAVGAAAVWFSQPAVLVLAGLGSALLLLTREDSREVRVRLLAMVALWAVSATASVAVGFSRTTPATRVYARRSWQDAFPPLQASLDGLLWLPRQLSEFWGSWPGFRYPLPYVFVALSVIGFVALGRRRRGATLLLLGPLVVTLAAAAARQYPFAARLILFLAPTFLLVAAEGAGAVADGLARLGVPRVLSLALLAFLPLRAFAGSPPVYCFEESRPAIAYLASRWRPGDAVYVYYGATLAFRYYAPSLGLDPNAATFGRCHVGDRRDYLRELDAFRGRPRVWILIVHAVRGLEEKPALRAYLQAIGVRRETFIPRESPWMLGSILELYDLSRSERQDSATAETFPLPPADPSLATRIGCDAGPHVNGP